MALAANAARSTTEKPAVQVRTPLVLDGGITAEIISFRNLSDTGEHVALVFPGRKLKTPLVRLHSECLTGDVFGSAHCDCGDQLREARERLSSEGGILIYLRQEGRGIGLYNKLRAYEVQHARGLDTFAANRHLGFADDQRNFMVAAEMLTALGIESVRLLTNNPDKAASLARNGISVEMIVPTKRYEKDANRRYLETKRNRGHLL